MLEDDLLDQDLALEQGSDPVFQDHGCGGGRHPAALELGRHFHVLERQAAQRAEPEALGFELELSAPRDLAQQGSAELWRVVVAGQGESAEGGQADEAGRGEGQDLAVGGH